MDRNRRRPTRIRVRRRLRWERVIPAAVLLAALLYGLIRLVIYGVELVSSRNTSQELRDAYYSQMTDAPAPTTAPPATPAPTAEPTSAPTQAPVAAAVVYAPTAAPTREPYLQTVPYPANAQALVTNRFRHLRKSSKYIVGWLTIDGLKIDEAVVQKDNTFFLTHDAKGKENKNGAIFLDDTISLKTRPYTLMLYGHNMKSGAMFGSLRNYEKLSFYHANPFITFDSMYEDSQYVVFSTGIISTEEYGTNFLDVLKLLSSKVADRQEAVQTLVKASVHTCTVDVRPDDQLLLLITCVDRNEERRVVAARRIRDGEDTNWLRDMVKSSRNR